MVRTFLHRRIARSVVGAFLAGCAVSVLAAGCSAPQSGMMAVTVDSQGQPVGVAVGCRYELRTGHLQRWVASPPGHSTVTPVKSPGPGQVADGDVASWALPPTTQEIVAWSLDARGTANQVRPLTSPPDLEPGETYELVGTSTSGSAHVVQFTLAELRHLQPGQAIVRDSGGEQRTIDLNQLVSIACTDSGLSATRSPGPSRTEG
jgi:hypothetical protein